MGWGGEEEEEEEEREGKETEMEDGRLGVTRRRIKTKKGFGL